MGCSGGLPLAPLPSSLLLFADWSERTLGCTFLEGGLVGPAERGVQGQGLWVWQPFLSGKKKKPEQLNWHNRP